jgi:hypothetical protein
MAESRAHVVDQLIQLAAVPAATMQLQLCQSSEFCKDVNRMTPKSTCEVKKHLDFFFIDYLICYFNLL